MPACTMDASSGLPKGEVLLQVSFGVHDEEERAGRMYDRAIIVERGRGAKTNFPLQDYEQEIADFEAFVEAT